MFEIEPFYEEIVKVTFRVNFIVLELFEWTRSQFHNDDGFISKNGKIPRIPNYLSGILILVDRHY